MCGCSRHFFFSSQSVRELKGGVLGVGEGAGQESAHSEEVCLPFGHFVLELALHTGEGLAPRIQITAEKFGFRFTETLVKAKQLHL